MIAILIVGCVFCILFWYFNYNFNYNLEKKIKKILEEFLIASEEEENKIKADWEEYKYRNGIIEVKDWNKNNKEE